MQKIETPVRRIWRNSLILTLSFGFMSLALNGFHTDAQVTQSPSGNAKITKIQLAVEPTKQDNKAEIVLDIFGRELNGLTDQTPVILLNSGGMNATEKPTIMEINSEAETRIRVKAKGAIPIDIQTVRLMLPDHSVQTDDFRITVEPVTPPALTEKPKTVLIKFETLKSLRSPDEFSLFITKEDGEGEFEKNANHMRVELTPPGPTDIRIRPGSNHEQLLVDFRAPEKYEVKNVVVTVYNSGNLDDRNIKAIAKPYKDKPPQADPNQPIISDAELIFVQRKHGYGRLKIEGKGFGDYPRAPFGSEDSCCYRHHNYLRKHSSGQWKAPTEEQKTAWRNWQEEMQERVKIELVPRNPDLRVDLIEILYLDDKLIDVYFEFTTYPGYSLPFRLARTTVSVKKPGLKQLQSAKTADLVAAVRGSDTYLAAQEIGPKRDKNLQYRYSILDSDSAAALFGRGVADNFYVIQLSVINNGPKKVAVPLAAIQAEIEWAAQKIEREGSAGTGAGTDENDSAPRLYFEGPPTLSPIPLQSVSGYFDSHVKLRGKRALMFNTLSGVGQLATGLFPVFGPDFRTGVGIFSNAFIPALKTAVGDLSGQQLQNLTGLSWETVEVLPSGGGSANKYVYIQRGEQIFNLPRNRDGKVVSGDQQTHHPERLPDGRKRIINIYGLEVTGFELSDSEAKQATQP